MKTIDLKEALKKSPGKHEGEVKGMASCTWLNPDTHDILDCINKQLQEFNLEIVRIYNGDPDHTWLILPKEKE